MNEKLILSIVEKFADGNIGELDLSDGSYRLTLRREQVTTASAPVAAEASTSAEVSAPSAEAPVRLAVSAGSESTASGEKINSPIVATYYAAAGPDAPPFVKPGTKVKAGDTLCILEAMKMMNHLEAEFNCEIIQTHAASGDLVEYGQPLFTVKRL
ncbi:MAG: acetyl-CoA carboxylase biotin carboxyl carrier protein [Treponema sp.]|nr:acetyl-CoA carboxylase biotin carboxyl carrier protein [Treponema sp.]